MGEPHHCIKLPFGDLELYKRQTYAPEADIFRNMQQLNAPEAKFDCAKGEWDLPSVVISAYASFRGPLMY